MAFKGSVNAFLGWQQRAAPFKLAGPGSGDCAVLSSQCHISQALIRPINLLLIIPFASKSCWWGAEELGWVNQQHLMKTRSQRWAWGCTHLAYLSRSQVTLPPMPEYLAVWKHYPFLLGKLYPLLLVKVHPSFIGNYPLLYGKLSITLWETIHCSLHRLFRASLRCAVLSWRNWDQICKSLWSNPLLLSSKINRALGSSEQRVVSMMGSVCVRLEGRKSPTFISMLMGCWSVLLSLMWMLKLSLKPRVERGKQHSSVCYTFKPWHCKVHVLLPMVHLVHPCRKIRAAIKKWSAALFAEGRHY